MRPRMRRRVIVIVLSLAIAVAFASGTAFAQPGVGETVVVEEGQTVSEVSAVAGTVIVRGTVTGDVSAVAGDVQIHGTVEGDVDVAAGSLGIGGTVGGDVSAGAGAVHLEEGATVHGSFNVGAAHVAIDGAIGGDATVAADVIHLGEAASIAGSLTYDGTLEGNLDAVEGEIIHDTTLGTDFVTDVQPIATAVFTTYAFVLNLLIGALLLGLFPRFSEGVAERVQHSPLRTGLIGLGAVVGTPILLVALLLTVIGIPIAIVGLLAFALLTWIGLIYGRFAVGAWLLSLVEVDNSWLALVVGLVIGAILSFVPVVGGIINAVIFLLGLGALFGGLYAHTRRARSSPSAVPPSESPAD